MTNWFRNLWSRQSVLMRHGPAKRACRVPASGSCGAEELELRTLLSGKGLASSAVAAEVAPHHAKAKFTPPDVAGSWSVTAGTGEGTITFTQDGANVSYTGTNENFPPVSGATKFKAKHVNALVDKTKVQTEDGVIKVKLVITFAPNQSEPQTFTGQFIIGKDPPVAITGNKQA